MDTAVPVSALKKEDSMAPKTDPTSAVVKIVSRWPPIVQMVAIVFIASGGGGFVGSELFSGNSKMRAEIGDLHKHVIEVDKSLEQTRQLHNDVVVKQSESITVIYERQQGVLKRLDAYEADMKEIKKLLIDIQLEIRDQKRRLETKGILFVPQANVEGLAGERPVERRQ